MKKTPDEGRALQPRDEEKRLSQTAKSVRSALTRTLRGKDKRGNPYRKDYFKGRTVTIYGKTLPPRPSKPAKQASKEGLMHHLEELDRHDEAETEAMQFHSACCYLVRRKKVAQPAKWSMRGPDVTLLRGDMARTALQGLWDDPEAMALARALESVHNHPQRSGDLDGNTLRAAVGTKTQRKKLRAAIKAMDLGGLVRADELPRPWRISKAVVETARILDRPPTPREAFEQFAFSEKQQNRKIWQEQGKTHERDLWKTKAQTNWYRDLARAGWGWLIGQSVAI